MAEVQNLSEALQGVRPRLDRALLRSLELASNGPADLLAAARYPIEAGGKRLRPALVHWVAQAEGVGLREKVPPEEEPDDCTWAPSAAIELIHTYSLVHDDLPCMDDDDLRRGKPTTHVVHGEALAVLVGDGLQALAFEVLATHGGAQAAAMVTVLARAAGFVGMVGGQALDLAAEGQPPDEEGLHGIHSAKTAALLGAACELGALAAGSNLERCSQWRTYGLELGLLFQHVDDLLDVTGSSAVLGKTPGKDAAAGKVTSVSLLGVAGAQRRVNEMARELEGLTPGGTGAASDILRLLPGWIAGRAT